MKCGGGVFIACAVHRLVVDSLVTYFSAGCLYYRLEISSLQRNKVWFMRLGVGVGQATA